MRKLLLLTITGLALVFSAASARAIPVNSQATYAILDGQGSAPTRLIVERAAITNDRGDQAAVVAPHRVGRSFYRDVRTLADLVILLATTALIFALGAVGVETLWIADRKESSFYGVLTESPYVLPDQPLRASSAATEAR